MGQSGNEREQNPGVRSLVEADAHLDAIEQFTVWFEEAKTHNAYDATAMTLATASLDGAPSARMVLLKSVDADGFSFFTNYESRKARELDANPKASLVFWWGALERQVRIEGDIKHLSPKESDEYFYSRPIGSRLGAWASPQSKVVADRKELEDAYQKIETECEDGDIPRPPFWGGYRVVPRAIEFWQGRSNRLHDRLLYIKQDDGGWKIERLAP
ncbi:MAG: pyridoxamine 5'-phosphate oxidase [Candidatus Hinthialibacter antarcticus]|nr:pyridoxamine 5'-phosphate oxidase [Candidatus Hinthialibacter antarcticus]